MSPRSVAALVVSALLLVAPGYAAAQAPGDERATEQWAIGPDTLFALPGAWDLSHGAGVVVAVVDSGTRLEHPDLAPNAWVNFGEVPGNGADDDANGYVDDVHGIDLTSDAPGQDLTDGDGHGTHVAGIIAAAANGRGVVGVADKARIMTVKVIGADGRGTTGAVAEGIRYAAANGAGVINLSLGGDAPDERLRAAIADAAAADVLVVCSAGNSGRDLDVTPSYPVSYAAANLVGVAATRPARGRTIADFSNFGRLTVPVAAPGEEVLSTTSDGGYGFKSGTSMAAPHVTGVAALMRAVAPALPAADVRAVLLQSAARAELPVGSGYVDALAAVRGAAGRAGITLGQRPVLRLLRAERAGRQAVVQFTATGALEGVRRFRVLLDGRRAAELRPSRGIVTVRLRVRAARRITVQALGADGRPVAGARGRVKPVPTGKLDAGSGDGVAIG